MSNKTEVMNRALIKAGVSTIASPTEESEQARKVNTIWPTAVQGELRRHAWNFAKKRDTLAPLASSPGGDDYLYGFTLPSDCLRLVSLNGNWVFNSIREAGYIPDPYFAIEGRVLLTNDATAKIVYIADKSEDVAVWDATFVETIACRLAVELAQPTTKSLTLKQSLKQDYVEALKEARRTNAIELPPEALADDSWVLARLW